MLTEDFVMNDDYILLQQVTEDHGVTARTLGYMTGLATSSVYKYLGGTATIPSVIWRALYERTRDQRILQLLTGELPIVVVDLADEPSDTPAVLADLIEQCKFGCEIEQHILKILADGEINKKDRREIEEYRTKLPESLRRQYQLFDRINRKFQDSVK